MCSWCVYMTLNEFLLNALYNYCFVEMFFTLFHNCGLSCCLCIIFHFVVWTHNSHRSKGSPKTPWLRLCRGEFGGLQFLINFIFPHYALFWFMPDYCSLKMLKMLRMQFVGVMAMILMGTDYGLVISIICLNNMIAIQNSEVVKNKMTMNTSPTLYNLYLYRWSLPMVGVVIHPQEIETAVTAMDGLDVGYPGALNIVVCIYLESLLVFVMI